MRHLFKLNRVEGYLYVYIYKWTRVNLFMTKNNGDYSKSYSSSNWKIILFYHIVNSCKIHWHIL